MHKEIKVIKLFPTDIKYQNFKKPKTCVEQVLLMYNIIYDEILTQEEVPNYSEYIMDIYDIGKYDCESDFSKYVCNLEKCNKTNFGDSNKETWSMMMTLISLGCFK